MRRDSWSDDAQFYQGQYAEAEPIFETGRRHLEQEHGVGARATRNAVYSYIHVRVEQGHIRDALADARQIDVHLRQSEGTVPFRN